MSLKDNELFLLRQLELESRPTSLIDLKAKLGDRFRERSVRRWLSSLVSEGSVKKIGQKRGTKYFAVDFTPKVMAFDEIRVRYRQQRRALIREVILREMMSNVSDAYIAEEANKLVPIAARDEFIKDAKEDLIEMNQSRLVVFGVSPEQLAKWVQKNKKNFSIG